MNKEKFLPTTFSTLEDIRLRKDQLSDEIERDSEKIGQTWNKLFVRQENSTKGEYIAGIIANSVTAIDAFLLVRKLMKNYSGLLSFFGKGTKRKKRR